MLGNRSKMQPRPKKMSLLSLATVLLFCCLRSGHSESQPECYQWSWECQAEKCVRVAGPGDARGSSSSSPSPERCRLVCGRHGALWPRPTGQVLLANHTLPFHPSGLRFDLTNMKPKASAFMEEASQIFTENLHKECGRNCSKSGDTSLSVRFVIASDSLSLTWTTEESYTLNLSAQGDSDLTALISSETVYGARHGLETLSQLFARSCSGRGQGGQGGLVVLAGARVRDRPAYAHRGLTLDTARHFMAPDAMRRTIDGLAATKMNVLHWHATDSQSFPLESPRVPQLARFGAYSPQEVYRPADIRALVKYARARGVRVLLELDAPAHSGAGWQWGPAAGLGELTVCHAHQPWRERCIQPPCGQLNPANANVFRLLGELFRDVAEWFPDEEVLHMGGDEVFFPCWNNTKQITDLLASRGMGVELMDFLQLWAEYQATAVRLWDEVSAPAPDRESRPIMLWSSHLTQPAVIQNFLHKDRYVIQTWVVSQDPLASQLSELGYRVIVSTKDAWYLDHGFWGSTEYHSWRTAYENLLPRYKSVLGGEACMWSEYVDDSNLDARVWPRTAAVGERLWSDPGSSAKAAEGRLARHRERLVSRGLQPEAIQPLWCYHNEGKCS